jgi:hypothetical protein
MSPRRAALAGLVFVLIAALFVAFPSVAGGHVDLAGLTMLIALGAAMSIMAYVLFAGISRS